MRPVIFDIAMATFEIAKSLNKLLTDLIMTLRKEIILAGYKMISLDVKNLLVNVPLDKTIDYILKRYTVKRKSKQTFREQP